jgi:hypothetical protein
VDDGPLIVEPAGQHKTSSLYIFLARPVARTRLGDFFSSHLRNPNTRRAYRAKRGEILSDGLVELDGFLVECQGGAQLGGANPGF